jgi:hypothetical protein
MNDTWDKDAWIKRAIEARHIVPREDGSVYRHAKTVRNQRVYKRIQFSTHKATGRVYFTLTFERISKSVLVNRVIGIAFLPNPLNLPEVNHIDGVKANNAKTNLEWASRSDQEKHAHGTGLKASRGSSNANAKLTAGDVLKIRAAPEDSLAQLAISLQITRKTITDIRERKTWRHL